MEPEDKRFTHSSKPSLAKTTFLSFQDSMFVSLSVSAKIGMKPFAGVRQRHGCLSKQFQNSGVVGRADFFLVILPQMRSREVQVVLDSVLVSEPSRIFSLPCTEPVTKIIQCERMQTNDRSNTKVFFLTVFSGIQHILPGFGSCQLSFVTNKTCYSTLHIFMSDSFILEKREKSSLITRICPYSQVKTFCIPPKRLFQNMNGPVQGICNSAMLENSAGN